ncbi:hypothetical protein CNR22_06975 [Sphingobacteriaceae bacterium]|nr:hypothetical protein CNR22_06975 [Sphingobacteriaceae bacterium]
MTNIAVIGAGQIGSRHLQALASLDETNYKIFVVDPTPESLATASKRYKELKPEDSSVVYLNNMEALPSEIELAIIATGSMVRKSITQSLLSTKFVKHLLLEKFLFPALEDYNEIHQLLAKSGTKAFVNCPRRMWDLYKVVKTYVKGPLSFEVAGNLWGLGSNGVHMLDIFSYLINDAEITLDGSHLDEKIHESKRSGYVEFTGSITGSVKDGSSFRCTSYNAEASPLTLFLTTKTHRIIIKEEGAIATLQVSSAENNWKWEEKLITIKFQSKLSDIVVNDLGASGTCDLTPYAVSATLHTKMLNLFLARMSQTTNEKVNICPIT